MNSRLFAALLCAALMLVFALFWSFVVLVGTNGFNGHRGSMMFFGNLGLTAVALLVTPWLSWQTPLWLSGANLPPLLVTLIAGIAVPIVAAMVVIAGFFISAVVYS